MKYLNVWRAIDIENGVISSTQDLQKVVTVRYPTRLLIDGLGPWISKLVEVVYIENTNAYRQDLAEKVFTKIL